MANISSIKLNNSTFETRPYVECSTAKATTAKSASLADFAYYKGASILVKFTNGNSASAPTLNINSVGAKSIRCNGVALTAQNNQWEAGAVLEFVYDGTYWNLMTTNNTDTNTDSDTKDTAGSSNKTGTKLLLVGATSTTTGTTYTNSNCYVGTDNCLYSGGTKVLTSHQSISGKQDTLVSGTNIKTVNSNSLLGSGNISVGTITKVQANGTDVSSSGTANIPAASTSAYGVTKLSSSTSSTSTSLAATASAVKSAYDLANGKQDKLTSGTNIKTINGQSVLGSGNITISAFADRGYTTDIIEPGLYKILGETSLNIRSITSHPNSIYTIYIEPIADPLEINYPTNFRWCNGEPNFASIGDDGKVIELNILVLDDGSSSYLNTCLCTWAVFE